ncbi:MAG: tetratricopeptide repeat protein [Proteobacteria bacterium]|nr:tetratricopeptide repeat protein [Pseudomonadota bacterium]
MDELTAHLDRGWDLLGRGDLLAARVSAERVLDLDADSPEGNTLLGAIVAADGDAEEALELFRHALEVDPENVDAMIYAADVALHPLRQYALALQYLEDAAAIASDDDQLDLGLLRAEAHVGLGDLDHARRIVDRLPGPPYADPANLLRLGRLCVDLDRYDRAVELLQQASEQEATRVDALYFLGIVRDIGGDLEGAQACFLAVHAAEEVQPAPPWALSTEDFAAVAHEALARVPTDLGERLRAAPLHLRAMPPIELVVEGLDPRVPVLFAGSPAGAEDSGSSPGTGSSPSSGPSSGPSTSSASNGRRVRRESESPPQPELSAIFIYQRNVERFAGFADAEGEELFRALIDEASGFFALSAEETERLLDAPAADAPSA